MSTNISKEKREKLVTKINEIKNYIAAAPQDENTAKLLTYIADIEKDIKGKKYGLVFEEHRESIDELLETHTPVLTEDESLFIDNGGQMNFLIEGDNLASLQLVSYEYIPTTGKSKGQLETKLIWNETLVVWLKDSTVFIDGEIYKTEILGTLWENISWGRLDLEGYVSFKNGKKPLSLLNQIMEFTVTQNSTILDFFAGSGTTGHAVMKLNAEDGGKRKFILCTNNENNICRDVTYERIKRVIDKEDYKASLKYFKVDYLPISDKLYYEYADELLKHIKELVELENGINFNGNAEITILLTEEELDEFTSDLPTTCRAIYLGHDVLPSDEQENLFKKNNIAVNIIPDYYYKDLEG